MINREVAIANLLSQNNSFHIDILSYFRPSSKSLKVSPAIKVTTVLPTKFRDFFYENPLVYPFVFFLVLYRLLKLKPDYVFVDLHQEAMWALLFRRLLGYKVCFTYHGVADAKFFPEKIAHKLKWIRQKTYKYLRKCDQVIAVSRFVQEELKGQGIESQVIYNGVDPDFFNPSNKIKNLEKKGPILLFIGRYSEYKGALNIVKAFKSIKDHVPDVELILHGFFDSEAYLSEIRKCVEENKLTDSCHIFGPVDWSEVPIKINQCDIFLNGSLDETFAMPLLEAQACGKPCVAFKAGGVPEVVKEYVSGFLAPPEDVGSFANGVIRLLNDQNLYKQFSASALENSRNFLYGDISLEISKIIRGGV